MSRPKPVSAINVPPKPLGASSRHALGRLAIAVLNDTHNRLPGSNVALTVSAAFGP